MSDIVQIMRKARSLLMRRGSSLDDADDIVQEAFARLEAYSRANQVKSNEAFVVNAALNISRDEARRRKIAPFHHVDGAVERIADLAPRADEMLRAQERLRRAEAGLAQISPSARRCLLAKRLDGLSYQEIAAKEGLSVAAAEKQVARALLFLTKWMDGW